MTNYPGEASSVEGGDRIDFAAVAGVVWRYKWFVALITVLGTGVAIAIALLETPIYRAEVVVTEVRDSHLGGAGSLSGQLSGLGALAGVSLGGGGSASHEIQAVLHSRHLVEEFITRNRLLDLLLPKRAPSKPMWLAVQRFQHDVLKIEDDLRKGTTTVSVEWVDPPTTARWANDFVALANEILRTRAMDDSKRNIAFLNDQIAQTNVIELRKVLYELVESETKTLMLANGRIEYAFTVVDPAVPSELRVRPKRALIAAFGLFAGLGLGVFLTLILNSVRVRRAGRPAHRRGS